MTAAATTKTDAVVAFRRRAELAIAGIGLAGSAVLQGGFALVIARSDDAALQATILPALRSAGLELDGARAHVVLNTLAAWFGFSFIVVDRAMSCSSSSTCVETGSCGCAMRAQGRPR